MLNRIIIIGRLAQDPELRYTQTGTAVTNFTVAVERPQYDKEKEKEADFIPVVVWSSLAEVVAQHLQKGRMVAVEGRLQIRSYENAEGIKIRIAEIVGDNVRFLDYPKEKEAEPPARETTGKGQSRFSPRQRPVPPSHR